MTNEIESCLELRPFPSDVGFPRARAKNTTVLCNHSGKVYLVSKQIERQNKSKLHRELIQENYSKCRKLEGIFWTIMLESYAGLGMRE